MKLPQLGDGLRKAAKRIVSPFKLFHREARR
jgi:hypothetical protein